MSEPKYIQYESLILTGRAVKRTVNWVVLHTAGESPYKIKLQFKTKQLAKIFAADILQGLKDSRTDWDYNKRLNYYIKDAMDQRVIVAALTPYDKSLQPEGNVEEPTTEVS